MTGTRFKRRKHQNDENDNAKKAADWSSFPTRKAEAEARAREKAEAKARAKAEAEARKQAEAAKKLEPTFSDDEFSTDFDDGFGDTFGETNSFTDTMTDIAAAIERDLGPAAALVTSAGILNNPSTIMAMDFMDLPITIMPSIRSLTMPVAPE